MKRRAEIVIALAMAVAVAGQLRADLVGYYTLDGVTTDSATTDGAQDMTLHGDASLTTPGTVGSGQLTVGGTGYATASSNFIAGASGVTISCWFTLDSYDSNTTQVLVQMPITGGTASQSGAALELSSGKLQAGGRSVSSDSFKYAASSTGLVSGTPLFGAAVLDYTNDVIDIYLYNPAVDTWYHATNGVSFANLTATGDQGLTIGRRADGQRYFTGTIDDVRIYNTAFNESDIHALAVPEPASLALIVVGGLMLIRRRTV